VGWIGDVDDAQAAIPICNVGIIPSHRNAPSRPRSVAGANTRPGGRVSDIDDAQAAIPAGDVGAVPCYRYVRSLLCVD
jgi:hypothetical protein